MSDESSLRVLVRDISGNSLNDENNPATGLRVERGCDNVVEMEQHQHENEQQQEEPLLKRNEREGQEENLRLNSKPDLEVKEKFEQQQRGRRRRKRERRLEAEFADDSVAIIHLDDEEEEQMIGIDQRRGSHRIAKECEQNANNEKRVKLSNNCCCHCNNMRGQTSEKRGSNNLDEEESEEEEERVLPTSSSSAAVLTKREQTSETAETGRGKESEKNQEVQRRGNCCKSKSGIGGCCQPKLNVDRTNNNNNNTMNSQSRFRLISAYFIAELVGTFLLVIIGDGTIAAYVLTKRPVDLFSACFAFGVGAMIASFASARISGAHINPAASFALALDGQLKWSLLPIYMLAQYVGGFLAALVLFLNYSEAIDALDGGKHSAFGEANSTGFIFATYPAAYLTIWASLLDQIVGTAVLLFSISAVTDKLNSNIDSRQQPLVIAFVIGLICLAFSPNCGAIFNPARDLPPRLITAIFNYPSVWSPLNGKYWILAGVVGPHIGAIIGVFAYKYTIGYALAIQNSFMLQQQQQERQVAIDKCSCLHNKRHCQS